MHTHFTSTSSVVGTGELQEMAAEPGAPTGSPRRSLCPLVCATVPRRPFHSDRSMAIIPQRPIHGDRSAVTVPRRSFRGGRSTSMPVKALFPAGHPGIQDDHCEQGHSPAGLHLLKRDITLKTSMPKGTRN